MIFDMEAKETPLLGTNLLTFTHRWTLDNFAHLYEEACQWKWKVESEAFSPPDNEEMKFCLTIWPKGKRSNNEEYLGVALYAYKVAASLQGKVIVKEIRAIEDEKGRKLTTKVYPDTKVYASTFINDDDKFVTVARLLDPSTGYLRKGTLTVFTQVTLLSQENSLNWPPSNVHTFSTTIIPSSVTCLSHRLTVSHFKWLAEERPGPMPFRVESQYFAPERGDSGKLRITLYPKGEKGNDEEKVWISIQNENASSLLLHYECSLVDGTGGKCHQVESTAQIPSLTGKKWFITRRNLLSLLASLPKDELIIDCQVTILAEEKSHCTPTPSCSFIDLALFTYHYVHFSWTSERHLKQASTQECTASQLFSPLTDSRYTAFLRLYPKKDSEYVTIELHCPSNCPIDKGKVEWRLALVNTKGEEWKAYVWSGVLEKSKGIGPIELISHQTLDHNRSFLSNDKLIIKSQVWFHEPRKNLLPELSNFFSNDPSADLARGVTNLIIGDNATFNNSILPIQTTLTAGNITQSSSSKSAESEP